MLKFGVLALLAVVCLPSLTNAGDCNIGEKCPDITVQKGKTSEYCSALEDHMVCYANLVTDTNCLLQITSISKGLNDMKDDLKDYSCGVAGLVASTLMCLLVAFMSVVVKG